MDELKNLYDLQQVLLEEKKLKRQLALLKEDQKLPALRKALEALEGDHKDKRENINIKSRELKKVEDQAGKVQRQRQEYEKKMYDGQITNAKELEQMQRKVMQLQKEEIQLEEKILNLLIEIDEDREVEERTSRELKEKKKELKDYESEYNDIVASLSAEIEKAGIESKELKQLADAKLYARFEAIAKQSGGIGIVEIKDGICGGCQVALSAYVLEKVWGGKGIVFCENCGRMFYFPQE